MRYGALVNPETNRTVNVKVWEVDIKTALTTCKTGSVKDLSWSLLEEKESIDAMEEENGDSASSNFALAVFEQALDWRLGLAIIDLLKSYQRKFGKIPSKVTIACDRKGRIYFISKTAKVIILSE
jgi:hypothetical protein